VTLMVRVTLAAAVTLAAVTQEMQQAAQMPHHLHLQMHQ
jgi:hypothetical protein